VCGAKDGRGVALQPVANQGLVDAAEVDCVLEVAQLDLCDGGEQRLFGEGLGAGQLGKDGFDPPLILIRRLGGLCRVARNPTASA